MRTKANRGLKILGRCLISISDKLCGSNYNHDYFFENLALDLLCLSV